jgi:DNA-binding transcriptional MocR family regulator
MAAYAWNDHSYDVVVVGAGGSGLRATLGCAQAGLKNHLRQVLPVYAARRDALLEALAQSMPPAVTWSAPQGGFCCWLTLPPGAAAGDLYQAALEAGLLLAPGDVFLVEPEERGHLRLCYGNVETEAIRQGVNILGTLLQEHLERSPERRVPVLDRAPLV